MNLIVPVLTAYKKLAATLSNIFSANNHSGILQEEWIQYKDCIAGTPDECSNDILTPTTTNNISDDAKQCDASFLFIPVTTHNHQLPSLKKSTMRTFLHSVKVNTANIFAGPNAQPAGYGCEGGYTAAVNNSFKK